MSQARQKITFVGVAAPHLRGRSICPATATGTWSRTSRNNTAISATGVPEALLLEVCRPSVSRLGMQLTSVSLAKTVCGVWIKVKLASQTGKQSDA